MWLYRLTAQLLNENDHVRSSISSRHWPTPTQREVGSLGFPDSTQQHRNPFEKYSQTATPLCRSFPRSILCQPLIDNILFDTFT